MGMIDWLPDDLKQAVAAERRRWLVTGAAGFTGSNLVEALLALDQEVVGLDNLSTGHRRNLAELHGTVSDEAATRFSLMEADIRDRNACARAMEGVDVILHQAALGSVPRSIVEPLTSHDVNVTGFANMIEAAR
jgi:UDP-N-acetylglucosamine 4-epimerase